MLLKAIIRIISLMVITLSITSTALWAQDATFTQYDASPLMVNPAYAGHAESGKISVDYRNQYLGSGSNFALYSVSYDQYVPAIHGGIGVSILDDSQISGAYNKISADVYYSYKTRLSWYNFLDFGIKAGFHQESVDWDKLIFADQLDVTTPGVIIPSGEIMPDDCTPNAIDFAAGIMWSNYNSMYLGFSVDHINQPRISYYETDNNRLNRKYILSGGFTYDITTSEVSSLEEGDFGIEPSFVVMRQGDYNQLIAGTGVVMSKLLVGSWYKTNFSTMRALVASAGIAYRNARIIYSYDIDISGKQGTPFGGAHEISMSCYIGEKWKNSINRTIKIGCF